MIFLKTLLFRIKGFEMILESYPQLIVNIFIMQALQLQEWLNITSCAISAFSVLYGFSDFIALFAFNGDGHPFQMVLWGILAIVIDTFLRAISMAYLMTFFGYTLLAGWLEYSAWKVGINAARRVDPTWNEHRGLLYPPLFYKFGWVEDPPYLGGTDPKYDVKPE